MSTLVVIGYNDLHQAEEVRLKLWKLQKDYLIDLEDAVVATKDPQGQDQTAPTRQPDGRRRGERGLLGLPDRPDLLESVARPGVGATAGAVSGALTDVGIDDTFMKDLAADDESGQLGAVRPGPKVHAGQGAGGAPGHRWHVLRPRCRTTMRPNYRLS